MRHDTNEGRTRGPAQTTSKCAWARRCGGEPRLDELLDDPIMTLLWRSDGLEPASARAMLESLRTLVQRRQVAAAAG
jgi:hypothetical protein